jgi:DedD protein
MNDHNLDDLIIDDIEPKKQKTISFLTIIALAIVLLIIAIILTKTLLKSPENTELNFEDNISDILTPELKLQEINKDPEITKPTEDEVLLESIMEESIDAQQKIKNHEPKKITTTNTSKEKVLSEPVKIIPISEEKNIITTSKNTKQEIQNVKNTKITQPLIQHKTIKTVKHEEKLIKTPKITKKSKTKILKTYYVQVGSFKENPSPRFLSVIKSSGFKYHVTNPDRTGYKKLLIGPYKTRAEVDKARDVIRDRIHKSAFVVQK